MCEVAVPHSKKVLSTTKRQFELVVSSSLHRRHRIISTLFSRLSSLLLSTQSKRGGYFCLNLLIPSVTKEDKRDQTNTFSILLEEWYTTIYKCRKELLSTSDISD